MQLPGKIHILFYINDNKIVSLNCCKMLKSINEKIILGVKNGPLGRNGLMIRLCGFFVFCKWLKCIKNGRVTYLRYLLFSPLLVLTSRVAMISTGILSRVRLCLAHSILTAKTFLLYIKNNQRNIL